MRNIANSKLAFLAIVAVVAVAMVAFYMKGHHDGSVGKSLQLSSEAQAAKAKVSPVEARERDFYAPNSEKLASDEMRVIACGTGMPTTRAAQAAACFLVELGNGDKFIFDIGTRTPFIPANSLRLSRQDLHWTSARGSFRFAG
jgi:deoxyhypusine synthase